MRRTVITIFICGLCHYALVWLCGFTLFFHYGLNAEPFRIYATVLAAGITFLGLPIESQIGWLLNSMLYGVLLGCLLRLWDWWRVKHHKDVIKVRRIVLIGFLLNSSVLFCLGISIYMDRVRYKEQERKQRQEHEHYLETRTPQQHLIDAICQDNIVEVRELLEQGVECNFYDSSHRWPLSLAIIYSSSEIVNCLLEHGATDSPDYPGALHTAAVRGNLDMVKILIAKGWDPKLRIKQNPRTNETLVSPLDVAIQSHKEPVIQYLRSLEKDNKNEAEPQKALEGPASPRHE